MRVRGGALAGLFVLSAAVGGCSGSSGSTAAPPVTTIAIATEAPAASTAPAAPPTAVSTTVVASTTTLVPPVPVLVRVTPKNDAERELLDAMKVLLPLHYLITTGTGVSTITIRAAYDDALVETVQRRLSESDPALYSEPGTLDRYMVTSVKSQSASAGSASVCYVNNGALYRKTPDGRELVDRSTVTRFLELAIERQKDGWRFVGVQTTTKLGGDRCAS